MIYEAYKTDTLWKMASHLGVKEADIPNFIREILKENPRLKDPDLIYPGERLLIRSSTVDLFIPKDSRFRTYWINQPDQSRSPSSIQQVQYKTEGTDLLSLTPRMGFSRIDARQRGTSSRATLLSSLNVGVKSSYSWKNRWGPGGLNLDLNWNEYDEELGQDISRNQVLLTQFDYTQGLSLSETWMILIHLGLYQSPYLFTDANNNLFLKVGTQPGFGTALQKTFLRNQISLNLQISYFYNGYAGDTVVDEGLAYGISLHKKWSLWNHDLNSVLEFNRRDLLTEVTSQEITELSVGVGWEF